MQEPVTQFLKLCQNFVTNKNQSQMMNLIIEHLNNYSKNAQIVKEIVAATFSYIKGLCWHYNEKISYLYILDAMLKVNKLYYTFYIEMNLSEAFTQLYSEIFANKKIQNKLQILQNIKNLYFTWIKVIHPQEFANIRYLLIHNNIEDIHYGYTQKDIQQIKDYYILNDIDISLLPKVSERQFVIEQLVMSSNLNYKPLVFKSKQQQIKYQYHPYKKD